MPITAAENGTPTLRDAGGFRIRFPEVDDSLDQHEEWFEFDHEGRSHRLRIHDYAEIFRIPGLYEALVYDKLQCDSPRRLRELFATVLPDWPDEPADLRVLDLGAGNGIVAEELSGLGVRTMIGLDLLPEAAMAAERDRPGLYRDYVVADLCDLDEDLRRRLEAMKLNCLVTVAALGFGDVPPSALATALNLISSEAWVGMTIKEDFLRAGGDESGFARLLRGLIDRDFLEIQAHLRFLHRVSVQGDRIFYVALVARKKADVPAGLVEEIVGRTDEASPGSDAASLLLGRG